MKAMHTGGLQRRARKILLVLAAIVASAVAFAPWTDSRADLASPSIDFHRISAGGARLRNSCYRLKGTVGQAAPGYSSSALYSLVAGFWSAAPITGRDEIFFNGFEGC